MSAHLGGRALLVGCREWLSPKRHVITGWLAKVSPCACSYTLLGACKEWLFLKKRRGTTIERDKESGHAAG